MKHKKAPKEQPRIMKNIMNKPIGALNHQSIQIGGEHKMIKYCTTHRCGWDFPIHEDLKKDNLPCRVDDLEVTLKMTPKEKQIVYDALGYFLYGDSLIPQNQKEVEQLWKKVRDL
jgi:hypothetical protein